MREVVGDMERRLSFEKGYHGKDGQEVERYGVASMELRFVLRGPKGATQFLLVSGWHLPETYAWWVESGRMPAGRFGGALYELSQKHGPALPADLGYHAYEPQYESQSQMSCDILEDQGFCYYDGSGLAADRVFDRLLREGEEGVWAELWDFYQEQFSVLAQDGGSRPKAGTAENT